jgi:hypothetical protein
MQNKKSNKQNIANALNSLNSTGPKTPEGKRTVSLNAMTHGHSGHGCFVAEHLKEDFKSHFQDYQSQWKPKGAEEDFLVHSLAQMSWSLITIRDTSESLMVMLGAKSSPWETGNAQQDFMAAQAAHFGDQMKQLNLLGLYENRKQRLYNTTRDKLVQIQTQRKADEAEALKNASLLRRAALKSIQLHEKEWLPSEDGFVCTVAEIDRFISYTDRLAVASGGVKAAA